MLTLNRAFLLGMAVMLSLAAPGQREPGPPEYTSDNQLKFPEHYREWVYLSTGFDMSYSPSSESEMGGRHMFDNVFADPASYRGFLESGTWPEKTLLVLEDRPAEGRGSINQKGNYQGTGVMGVEVHVKDKRFPGGWAFFGFDGGKTAKAVPFEAACYSCHAQHAAVDTTFVQFYPTLLPIAEGKGTLSSAYRKESGAGH